MAFQLYPLVQLLTLLFAFVKGSLGNNISMKFTAKPKDAEHLVGTEGIFEWEYLSQPPDSVEQIQFGFSLPQHENADVAVLVKYISSQEISRNPETSLIKRTSVVENKPASFKITNLTLNDTGSYFCAIRASRDFSDAGDIDYVKLTVVDLLIDTNRTTSVIESWEGHKIHLMCAVNLANPESEVRFTWTQGNRSKLVGKQVDWKTESQMTIITQGANGFLPVICTAKTAASTQRCNITIKWLHKPAPPQNVSVHKLPSNDTDCAVYNRITWDPPLTDGGSPITGYSVEYRQPILNRLWVNRSLSHDTEHVICMIQDSEYPRELNVIIRGVNKIGRGARSAVKQVLFLSIPSAPLKLRTHLERNEERPLQVVITWDPPATNGGSPIGRYVLEYKSPASSWQYPVVKETNSTQIVIRKGKRQVGLIYEVRVKAENTIGFGAPSKVVNATFAEKPSAPEDLAKHSLFYNDRDQPSVKVDWNPPNDDGGSEVTHYVVEYKTVKTKWSSATKEEVKTTHFSWQVKISETYTVRVRASNQVGTGQPSNVVMVKFTEQDAKNLARSQGLRLSLPSFILMGLLSLWFSVLRL